MSDANRATDYTTYQQLEAEASEKKLNVHGPVSAITLSDMSQLSQNELKVRASQLATQKATIEHVMAGGKIRCMLQNTQNPFQFNYVTVALLCCKVPSSKRSEQGADEANEFLRQYLFRQATLSFQGGLEKFTNALFCSLRVDGANVNV